MTGTHVGSLAGHENRITQLSVAPAGFAVATASWDNTVRALHLLQRAVTLASRSHRVPGAGLGPVTPPGVLQVQSSQLSTGGGGCEGGGCNWWWQVVVAVRVVSVVAIEGGGAG